MSTARDLIKALARQSAVRESLDDAKGRSDSLVNEAVLLQQIPAPTFDEARRASYVQRRFDDCNLGDVSTDDLSVVYARIPGADPDAPAVLVAAHLDTVFPGDTDLSIRRDGDQLHGPGIGDNAVGIAALLALPSCLLAYSGQLPADVWLVGTVGEEGLGNLRGMQRTLDTLGEKIGLVIVIEGMALGHVFHQGLAVRRLKLSLAGPGGHSWLNHGKPSAVHTLLQLGADITHVAVSSETPSSLNIGLVDGGTAVNAIADRASLSIDLRSENLETLDALENRVRAVIDNFDYPARITASVEIIGDRPAGSLPRQHPLVQASGAALNAVGIPRVKYRSASTDANIALANGLAAVCIGVTSGGNAHSAREYINVAPVSTGLQQLVLLTLAAAHHSREWAVWDNVG